MGDATGTKYHDVTEQRQLEQTLRESQQQFHTLANSIPQLAWMADAAGYIFWYNQRWYDYTGTTLEDMQGWGWHQVHHPDEVERVVERIQRAFSTGEAWDNTFPLRSKEGEFRWFFSRALPIRDADGRVVRWFGTKDSLRKGLLGRIVAASNVFDAGAGGTSIPHVAALLPSVLDQFEMIRRRYLDTINAQAQS